jgi:putative Mn2+ efflux pump MntP
VRTIQLIIALIRDPWFLREFLPGIAGILAIPVAVGWAIGFTVERLDYTLLAAWSATLILTGVGVVAIATRSIPKQPKQTEQTEKFPGEPHHDTPWR